MRSWAQLLKRTSPLFFPVLQKMFAGVCTGKNNVLHKKIGWTGLSWWCHTPCIKESLILFLFLTWESGFLSGCLLGWAFRAWRHRCRLTSETVLRHLRGLCVGGCCFTYEELHWKTHKVSKRKLRELFLFHQSFPMLPPECNPASWDISSTCIYTNAWRWRRFLLSIVFFVRGFFSCQNVKSEMAWVPYQLIRWTDMTFAFEYGWSMIGFKIVLETKSV